MRARGWFTGRDHIGQPAEDVLQGQRNMQTCRFAHVRYFCLQDSRPSCRLILNDPDCSRRGSLRSLMVPERYIGESDLKELLANLAGEKDVFVPVQSGNSYRLVRMQEGVEFSYNPYRTVESIKFLLCPPRERVAESEGKAPEVGEQVAVGVKRCDVTSLEFLDHVFLKGPFVDPRYKARRERTLVISSDCREATFCFCEPFGCKGYPENGFDLNLSEVKGGCVVEVGSDKGQALVDSHKDLFREAAESQLSERDENRKKELENIAARTREAGLGGTDEKRLREAFLKGYDSDIWEKYADKCVECGACNFVCPTCHCFVLLDVEEQGGFKRFRNWDSCLYPRFARVAGEANPRKRRAERLRNRIEKKFDFFVQELNRVACTGCGRCTEACAGGIRIQDILKELVGG